MEDYDSNYQDRSDSADNDMLSEDENYSYKHHLVRRIQFPMNKKDSFFVSPKYFQDFIAKSHNDMCKIKHANTKKSANDEIISCIGEILKEK